MQLQEARHSPTKQQMPNLMCRVPSHCHSPSQTCSPLLWTNWGPLQDPLLQPHTLIPNKELQEWHRAIQIHRGSSGQQPTISNQMGHCTPCSTLKMRYTTMWRLSLRENGDSYSNSSHHAKQEGRNCIDMPPPCQVPIRECSGCHLNCEIGRRLQPLAPGQYFSHLLCCPLFVMNCILTPLLRKWPLTWTDYTGSNIPRGEGSGSRALKPQHVAWGRTFYPKWSL